MKISNTPKISVITVVQNGSTTIRRCIESVLMQTYRNIEHIIVDGGSIDGTIVILKEYQNRIGPWVTEPDTGIYNALNKGLKLSTGEYYIPLGCDDFLLSDAIQILVDNSIMNVVTMGRIQSEDSTGPKNIIYGHSAGSLIYKRLHDSLGYYDESYKIAADTKFLESAKRLSLVKQIMPIVGHFSLGGASSNYLNTVSEHARAMRESGRWSKSRSWIWYFPRIVFFRLKNAIL